MKLLKGGFFLLLASLMLVSCNDDDDGYSLGDYWISTGTVTKTGDYYFITTDGDETLWPSATEVNPSSLTDGMRVLVNYTILGDGAGGTDYDYYVRVNSISEILTKPIFNFTAETTDAVKDSIGNDAVSIVDSWFSNQYLNVQFEYGGGLGYVHFINLVQDSEDRLTDNGEIILELKHNKNGDPYNYLHWGIASFDITELQVEGQTSVDIFVRSLGKSGEYEYNKVMTYEYGEVVTQARTFKNDRMLQSVE